MRLTWFGALALSLCASAAGADTWTRQEVMARASPTGTRVVRVVPGSDMGAVFGFAGESRGPAATATVYRLRASSDYVKDKEFQLLNPIGPVFLAITDSGELVTVDNWHNVGIGNSVVVVYSVEGRVVRALGLKEMYSPADLSKFQLTTSSVWWRCNADPTLNARTSTLEIRDVLGAIVQINLKTGAVQREPAAGPGC